MNQKWNGTAGLVIVALLLVLSLPVAAVAQSAGEAGAVNDPAIKIYRDGALLTPADDASKPVEPLLYDGNVYLPLWVLREALGKSVEWDSAAGSVYIGESAEIAEITVSTAEELLLSLGSNRRILLKEGVYNLTSVEVGYINANAYFAETPDGGELFLDGVHNLTLQGAGDGRSEIIVEPRYANVINFRNCSNISIGNIKAGHTDEGMCSGGVFFFDNCTEIRIDDTDMYGCGTLGLILNKVTGVRVTGSTIYECTAGIMNIQSSSDILLKDCVFRDNTAYDLMIGVEHTSGLTFDSCSFLGNTEATSLFYVSGSENIALKNTELKDNIVQELTEWGELWVDASCQFEGNLFDDPR